MSNTSKLLISLTCPSCGGQVECEEGEDLAICKFCDSVFSVEGDEGSTKIMYKLTVDQAKALKYAKDWLGEGHSIAPDVLQTSTFDEIYPIYIPFWRLNARGKACVCGYEEHKDSKDNTTRVPKEALINREYVYTSNACSAGDLGINSILIPERAEAIPYDEGSIVTFGVTSSRDESFNAGVEEIRNEALNDGKAGLDGVTFSKAFVFPKGFTLIYYPFWIIRYTYQERSYFVTVDGIKGGVSTGRAPGSIGTQTTAAGAGGAVSGALVGIGAGLAMMDADSYGGVGIMLLVVACVAFYYCYQRFRYGDEIILGNLAGKGYCVGKQRSKVDTVVTDTYDYRY